MKGLTIIRTADEWHAYRDAVERDMGWQSGQVQWGTGPTSYPAIVCSYSPAMARVVSCYVYIPDAVALLKAGGYDVGPAGVAFPDGWAAKQAGDDKTEPLQAEYVRRVDAQLDQQRQFNQQLAAVQLSLVQVMMEAKLTTTERFEAKVASNRAVVDRWHTQDKEKLKGLVDGANAVLGNT